jgi:hypothetical protein
MENEDQKEVEPYVDSGYGPLGRWFLGSRCESPGFNDGCDCDACYELSEDPEWVEYKASLK